MSVITYTLQSGKINFDVKNITRDFQVIYADGKPDSIQIWRYTEYWADGQLMKTDPAACTVVKVADLPQDIGSTGLKTPDIIAILESVLASTVSVPAGATAVVLPGLPDGVVDGRAAAEAQLAALGAEGDFVKAQLSQARNDLALLNGQITQASNDLSANQTQLVRFGTIADQTRYDTTTAIAEMEARLEAAKQNLILTQESLKSKCDEATALSNTMREALNKIQVILDQQNPKPVVAAEVVVDNTTPVPMTDTAITSPVST